MVEHLDFSLELLSALKLAAQRAMQLDLLWVKYWVVMWDQLWDS